MAIIKSIALYCTEGSSDKEYHVSIEEADGGYVVNYANGRRGSTLRNGTKTNSPINLNEAQKIYDKLVKSKVKGGYTEAESGARYVGTDLEARDSGLSPMLPTAIDHTELLMLKTSQDWAFQEKHDGENRILVLEGSSITGVNRRGLTCPVREDWSAPPVTGRTVLAGEDMGERFVAFDALIIEGEDVSNLSLLKRHRRLEDFASSLEWADVSPLATSQTDKGTMMAQIEFDQGEGIVAKRISAPYEGGRSDQHLKFKFEESATFEVIRVNNQRSVGLGLYDAGKLVDLGNVTVPSNHEVPAEGDLVEVSFMMRYENGGLMQPKYKGKRTDLEGKPSVDQITRVKAKKAA